MHDRDCFVEVVCEEFVEFEALYFNYFVVDLRFDAIIELRGWLPNNIRVNEQDLGNSMVVSVTFGTGGPVW